MEQKILTDNQKLVLKLLAAEENMRSFYLSGGTALAAFYLGHRFSDDLDFFNEKEFDKNFIHSFVKKLKKELRAENVKFEKLYDRNIFVFKTKKEELKIEFTFYPFTQLGKSLIKEGIKIDSLRDAAANKLMALLDRFDPKDFVDMYFLLQRRDLEEIKNDTEKKFGIKISDMFLGSELSKAKRIEALPIMIKKITVQDIKSFFEERVKELGKNIFKDDL